MRHGNETLTLTHRLHSLRDRRSAPKNCRSVRLRNRAALSIKALPMHLHTHSISPRTIASRIKKGTRRTANVDGFAKKKGNDDGRVSRATCRFPQKGCERCRRDSAKQFVTVDRGARTKASAILSRVLAATRKVDGAPRARRDGERVYALLSRVRCPSSSIPRSFSFTTDANCSEHESRGDENLEQFFRRELRDRIISRRLRALDHHHFHTPQASLHCTVLCRRRCVYTGQLQSARGNGVKTKKQTISCDTVPTAVRPIELRTYVTRHSPSRCLPVWLFSFSSVVLVFFFFFLLSVCILRDAYTKDHAPDNRRVQREATN